MYKIERVFVDTRKRKRRTSLEGAVRSALESYFVKCPKPNTQEITHISDDLGLERDVSMKSKSGAILPFLKTVFSWLHFQKTNAVLGRWYAFGSATGDRKESALPCHWMRIATASITSTVLPH